MITLTSASRIQDLEAVLMTHKLTMSATATGGLWTVVLDAKADPSDPRPGRHFMGSGGSLFEALQRALAKLEGNFQLR